MLFIWFQTVNSNQRFCLFAPFRHQFFVFSFRPFPLLFFPVSDPLHIAFFLQKMVQSPANHTLSDDSLCVLYAAHSLHHLKCML